MDGLEKRYFKAREIRAEAKEGSAGTISGYAIVFDELSEELGFYTTFREKIRRGAFADSMNGDVYAFWSHDSSVVLGRTTNKTLRLKEDAHGVGFELDLPDTTAGRDAFALIKRGDVSGMSFGFMVETEEWDYGTDDNEDRIRTIVKGKLFEVSPTAFPAYPQTEVDTRSLDEVAKRGKEKLPSISKTIREFGTEERRLKLSML